jgi:hypothetical protein
MKCYDHITQPVSLDWPRCDNVEPRGERLVCALDWNRKYDLTGTFGCRTQPHIEFLNLKTDGDLTAFVRRRGPLWGAYRKRSEASEVIVDRRRCWAFHRSLKAKAHLMDAFRSGERSELADAILECLTADDERRDVFSRKQPPEGENPNCSRPEERATEPASIDAAELARINRARGHPSLWLEWRLRGALGHPLPDPFRDRPAGNWAASELEFPAFSAWMETGGRQGTSEGGCNAEWYVKSRGSSGLDFKEWIRQEASAELLGRLAGWWIESRGPKLTYGLGAVWLKGHGCIFRRAQVSDLAESIQWMLHHDLTDSKSLTFCRECGLFFRPDSAHARKYDDPLCARRAAQRAYRKRLKKPRRGRRAKAT